MRAFSNVSRTHNSTSIPENGDASNISVSYGQGRLHTLSSPLITAKKEILSEMKGFTLMELLITVIIVMILAVLASFGTSFVRQERLRSATKDLVVDLQSARADAMRQGTSDTVHGVGIRFTANSYVRFTFSDTSVVNYQYDDPTEELNTETRNLSSSQVQMLVGAALLPPALPNNVIIFDSFGYPRQPDWQRITDKTVVISDPALTSYIRCVRIRTSRIREGTWDGAACNDQ